MNKSARAGRGNSAPFFTHAPERALLSHPSHGSETHRGNLVDAVIGGERVYVATDPAPREKGIQIQIVHALTAANEGVRVLQHRIFPCHKCGARPSKHQGLGEYAADILCIVKPHGRACFIEVKRPGNKNAKRDEGQRNWAHWIRRFGGVAGIATSVEEALALVEEARRPA